MGKIAAILAGIIWFGIGYVYLRSYWAGCDGLNGELFD